MKNKHKLQYHSPLTEVFEIKYEGIICASNVKSRNSINDWGNGGTTNDQLYF
ncbi:MAG: hypothetical protein J6U22_10670 [Bacteroidaceae bacterium]|nr:hypothetical protein [Bacteroidaceae bacterium]